MEILVLSGYGFSFILIFVISTFSTALLMHRCFLFTYKFPQNYAYYTFFLSFFLNLHTLAILDTLDTYIDDLCFMFPFFSPDMQLGW